MRPHAALVVSLAAGALAAQDHSTAPPDKTRLEISRLEELVREGAVAKSKLDQAKSALADAEDEAILKRTLFGHLTVDDLTGDQAAQMVGAATRRVDRVKLRLEAMRKLVDDGIVARTELTPILEELDLRRRTLDLAESRRRTLAQLVEMIEAEQLASAKAAEERAAVESATPWRISEKYEGNGWFRLTMLSAIEMAFKRRFDRDLPVSALGMTTLHRTMGFDHRDRVDVAIAPDSAEGVWLRKFLETNRIPYFAFRSFSPGQATAPHIHIGPPSLRIPKYTSLGAP
jgi:hypothetical protein